MKETNKLSLDSDRECERHIFKKDHCGFGGEGSKYGLCIYQHFYLRNRNGEYEMFYMFPASAFRTPKTMWTVKLD